MHCVQYPFNVKMWKGSKVLSYSNPTLYDIFAPFSQVLSLWSRRLQIHYIHWICKIFLHKVDKVKTKYHNNHWYHPSLNYNYMYSGKWKNPKITWICTATEAKKMYLYLSLGTYERPMFLYHQVSLPVVCVGAKSLAIPLLQVQSRHNLTFLQISNSWTCYIV